MLYCLSHHISYSIHSPNSLNTMTEVLVISTTTIQATKHGDENSTHKIIDLVPWDLKYLKLAPIQKGLLFHKPNTNQIDHLKQTLSSTLNFFPPLAGRLVITQHDEPNNASCSIICNNAGALFVHAKAEHTAIADILQPKYVPPIVSSLFLLNEVQNYEGTSQPLLAVQVTELIDGIFIGFAINHVGVDAKSFWHFINSWAEISQGFNKPTNIPSFKRWFSNNINRPIRFPFTKEAQKQPFTNEAQNQQCEVSSHRIFHFSKEQILQLKSKANAEISSSNSSEKIIISSLQALLSHVWRLIISKQNLKPEERSAFVLPIDCRTRMCPKLEDNYFGSGIGATGYVIMQVGELMESGIGKIAMEMNKVISIQSHHEKVVNNYESWLKTPSIPEAGRSSSNLLIASSSPRFNYYGNDFGWGKPIAVRNGVGLKRNIGRVIVLGGEEEGSVDIQVCLPYDILEAMGNDHLSMDAITV
ncbi:putative omega-hydroxypalmitate O-feruloyl transferase [Medicago truncatula]|uniref:Putative omega-hydroxypalmitate O-feruloyl transferase n=1 Tax=Medicago truncatula TaxID=3880 RepID=A0A396GUG9_MEDTR|nr:protein ENHANCED PSEUDOMONAS SUSCEPTIBILITY 1-like [Medicago truncatula]RHN42257.1 putative omega-hydroxypalmitate O-feruloyl transferase [Medicago truncatula]